jgi:hypothetical protein
MRVWGAAAMMSASTVVTACHARDDERQQRARPTDPAYQVDLFKILCDGGTYCDDFDRMHPSMTALHLELADCKASETALLFGSWSVADANSPLFGWEAEVRYGGVFPAFNRVGTNLGCFDEHPPGHTPDVGVRVDPEGFEWARLEGDDVFIPFRGKATIDHAFTASAKLDIGASGAGSRVTVFVEGPDASLGSFPGLGPGDGFSWGGHRAAIVRIVTPQDGLVGAIGWVEIDLSGGVPRPSR